MIEQFKSLPPLQESLKSEYPTRSYMAFEVWRNFLKLIGKYFGNWCGLSESLADFQSVIGSRSFYSNESGNNIPTSKNCISQNTWSFKLKFGGHSEVQKKNQSTWSSKNWNMIFQNWAKKQSFHATTCTLSQVINPKDDPLLDIIIKLIKMVSIVCMECNNVGHCHHSYN